jgi:hypothetical protein
MDRRPAEESRRAVARRLFKVLCGRYPDRYIALVEPPCVVDDPVRAPLFAAVALANR